jgi:hypothetical protein
VTAASELDLPEFDTADTTLHGAAFHEQMTALAARGWLARTPLGYLVLDREAGEHFLRSRDAVFPGQLLAEMFGVDAGPLREEIDRNLLHLDGDVHRRLRSLVGPSFTPARGRPLAPGAAARLVADLFDRVAGDGRCDGGRRTSPRRTRRRPSRPSWARRCDADRLADWSQWIQRQFDGPSLLADRRRIEQACTSSTRGATSCSTASAPRRVTTSSRS